MSGIPRKTPMPPRRERMARGTNPFPKVNPVRQAKRRVAYAAKLRAYRRSETFRVVEERAGGRCEFTLGADGYRKRCGETLGLSHHHLTYARFGGDELPEDMQVLCKGHHELAEGEKSYRAARRQATQGGDRQ